MKQAIKEDAKRARTEVGPGFVELIKKKLLEAAVERIEAEHRGSEVAEDECAICVVRSLLHLRSLWNLADTPSSNRSLMSRTRTVPSSPVAVTSSAWAVSRTTCREPRRKITTRKVPS